MRMGVPGHTVKANGNVKAIILASLIVSAFHGCSTQAQNLILNGAFESPTVPANTSSQTIPDSWLGGGFGDGYIGIINGDYSPGYPLPHGGQQYGHLGFSSSLSQEFTVSRSGKYVLRWFDSTEFNGPDQTSPYTLTILDSGTNTVATENFDANTSALRLWTQRSIVVNLAPGTYTLLFEGHAGFFAEQSLLDDITLNQYSAGFVWNRLNDYQAGTVSGSTNGNPNVDQIANPTWHYSWLDQNQATPEIPWYATAPNTMVWSSAWFGRPELARWQRGANDSPIIGQFYLGQANVFSSQQQYAPLVRWRNPTGRNISVD